MPEKASIIPVVVLVAIVLVAGGATGAYLYEKNRPKSAPTPLTVAVGDNITVNYIGILGSGPEQGKVFDTSLLSVAYDNATYPKALQYSLRGSLSQYAPLPVYVGPSAPNGQYTLNGVNFSEVIPGFWQGLVGLPGNQSHAIVVPPALGYPVNSACIEALPLTVKVPVFETISGPVFTKRYPTVVATTGASFDNTTYGWKTVILSANSTSVTIENLAQAGNTTYLQGWPAEVTNVTSTANGSGMITVQNELTPTEAGHLKGTSSTGLCSSTSEDDFIVTAVNYTSGTFTEDYNQEVDGATLIFVVTVIDIYVPVAAVV